MHGLRVSILEAPKRTAKWKFSLLGTTRVQCLVKEVVYAFSVIYPLLKTIPVFTTFQPSISALSFGVLPSIAQSWEKRGRSVSLFGTE